MQAINRDVTVQIDRERCTGCEACLRVCPSGTISMVDGKAAATGSQSLGCGHCAAVCPVAAIEIGALANDSQRFATFQHDPAWLAPGTSSLGELVRLMRSRRSCRNYQDRAVPLAMLEDLVKIAATAPSGTNCQLWSFTLIPSRAGVLELSGMIAAFFKRLNRLAARRWLRNLLKLTGKPALEHYYRNYFASVAAGLTEWEQAGRDVLFHGATAVIIVGARPGASCPKEDALLATQNLLLGAHAMGLGTCLIGFAVSAFQNAPAIQARLGIPAAEVIHAVAAVGFPDERYQRLPGRKAIACRTWSP